MKDYEILQANNIAALSELVNFAINNGYDVTGGIHSTIHQIPGSSTSCLVYYQAVIKDA